MRHKKAPKRIINPDPIYASVLVSQLTNRIMKDGKKTTAEKHVYALMDALKEKGMDPIATLDKAILTISPKVELKARRVGGANYQVPIDVRPDRRVSLGLRWLVDAARSRSNKEYHFFWQKLLAEITDALNEQGAAITKRNNTLKQAEANKAFAHFRF